ncbi:Asp-tRNA(Asn)/Glu-tRNA(Gln) amidotransferase subunit GatA [bacterium]|nr:Asp-tRNA(Asn)/Glu-tRNA(Gln) amidotransferase subunit GatA [bacterium]
MELTNLTICQIHQGLIKKEFSALELTKAFFDKIDKEDKKIRALITINEKSALGQAKKIDDLILQGIKIPLLAGVPAVIKDNILVEGLKCTAASLMLENYIAPYDAFVIKKLKSQGVIILGKANMDEFAIGSSGEYSAFGVTRNPHDSERVPGGSSSGSAAAVAANMTSFALGSDTGGSIRLPASFCGVVGMKPTYGRVSRSGLIAMASSLDQIGPITKTVKDNEIVFEAIKGKDPLDSTSVEPKLSSFNFQISNLKIGVPKEYFIEGINPEVKKLVMSAIKRFEEMGAKIEEISLPHTEYALPAYYIIMTAEVSSNLARYDGVKYGFTAESQISDSKLLDIYLQTREKGFGEEVKRRIMLGTYVLSAGYYEDYYLKAQKVRTLIREDFKKAFQKVDIILTPISPTPAFKIGEKVKDPLVMYLSDIFTVSLNLAGLPGIAIPCGKTGKLPVGFQLIGKPFQEKIILEAGKLFEETYHGA